MNRYQPQGIEPSTTEGHQLTTTGGRTVWAPPPVLLLEAEETDPPPGTPTGTIIFRKVTA